MSDVINTKRLAAVQVLRAVAEAVDDASVHIRFTMANGATREIPAVDPELLIKSLMAMARAVEGN